MTAQRIAQHTGDQGSIVSRRRTPRVYVTDATGGVLMQAVAEGSFSRDVRGIVLKLVASHPGDEVVLGLAASGELIRLVRLLGDGRPCFALFIETLATRSPIDAACKRYGLSERERDVLSHVLRGTSTAEIARELSIAESTVATHVRNIGARMKASKRKEIVAAVLGGR